MTAHTPEAPARRRTSALDAVLPGRYLAVTSFKRDGTGVATPVWFVSDGRRLYALTDRHSAKVRRIRRDPAVLVAPCRANGTPRGEARRASAEILTADDDLDRVQALLRDRYPLSYRVVMRARALGRRLRGSDPVGEGAVVAITLDDGPADAP